MFSITTPELPGAVFYSREALLRHASERLQYDEVVETYAVDREPFALADGLNRLGYSAEDVRWHVDHAGQRIAEGYF